MAYKIYFDGVEVSSNYIYELPKQQTLFSDTFVLGCTPMAQYKMVIEKSADTNPSIVTVKDGDTLVETLLVDNKEDEDELTVTYTLVDYMAKFEFQYDGSEIIHIIPEGETEAQDVPVSLLTLVQDICSKAGVTLATTTFTGADKMISWYDSRITAREYIGYVAELNGGYACMNANGELQFIAFDDTPVDTIAVEDCENFKVGEQHIITRVVYDNEQGIKWEYGDETGETYYVDINNVYVTDTSDIEAIYNVLNGYEYWALSVDNCPINNVKIGETVAFTLDGNTYKTIAQIEQTYAGDGWFGGYKLDVKSSQQAETIVRDAKTMVKTIETRIDRELGEFQRTISQIETQVDGSLNHITYLYAYGDSATTKPSDSAFTYSTMPPLVDGKYIWRMSLAYTNENPSSNPTKTYEMIQGATGQPGQGEKGEDGYNSATINLYRRATSTPSKPAATSYTFSTHSLSSVPSGWSTTVPSGTNPLYISIVSVSSKEDTVNIASSDWSTPQIMASNGTNGTSYYTHIRYSANSDGSSMTSSPQTNTKYIGVYTGTSSTAPTTASSYTWSKYVGDNITITSVQYTSSTSGVFPAPTSGWQSSPPTVAEGSYLWTKVNYSTGDPSYSVAYQGMAGTSVSVRKISYQAGTSSTTAPTGTWLDNPPTVAQGSYLWTKTEFTNGSIAYSVARQGEDGDSVTVTEIRYGTSTSGTSSSSVTNWQATVPTVAQGSYLWTRTKYSDGTYAYTVSRQGADGDDGVSVTQIDNLYYLKDALLDISLNGNTTQGANPSPSSPQAIHTVTGDNVVMVTGKNLMLPTVRTVTANGVTYSVDSDGKISMKGTCTSNVEFTIYTSTSPKIPKIGVYSCSLYGADKATLNATSRTFNEGVSPNFGVVAKSGTVYDEEFYAQIEQGSTATTYEPYKAQVYPINLGSIELNALGDYKDYFYKSDGKWYLHKAIDKALLVTTGGGAYGGMYRYMMKIDSARTYTQNVVGNLCTHFTENASVLSSSGIAVGQFVQYRGTTKFYFATDITSRINFNTWASENGVTVYYALATPTETEITDETLIAQLNALQRAMSYDGGTSILQTNSDNPFAITYETSALTRPNKPTAEVTSMSTLPEVWSLQTADYISGYRFYTCLQIHYDNNTLTWTDVVEDKSLQDVREKIVTMSTDIIQNTEAITLKADSSTVEQGFNDMGDRIAQTEQANADLQVRANSISSSVSETRTLLETNYATKSELTNSVNSLSTTIQQTAQDIQVTITDVQEIINSQGSQITTLETYLRATSRGLEISRSNDEVTMVLGNSELGFFNRANVKLAWLNTDDGLGANALSIGDANTASNRWRVFTRENGSHLTFTRHS